LKKIPYIDNKITPAKKMFPIAKIVELENVKYEIYRNKSLKIPPPPQSSPGPGGPVKNRPRQHSQQHNRCSQS
jgi:hypothetical protein